MNDDFLKVFEELNIKAQNLHIAMDIIAEGRDKFGDQLKDMHSDFKEIKDLEQDVNLLTL